MTPEKLLLEGMLLGAKGKHPKCRKTRWKNFAAAAFSSFQSPRDAK